jgi:ribosome-associated protein
MPQVKAICDQIKDGLEQEQVKVWHIEGYSNLQWVLMDYVDVVVHIFLPELREFYGLERLWGDAILTEIDAE